MKVGGFAPARLILREAFDERLAFIGPFGLYGPSRRPGSVDTVGISSGCASHDLQGCPLTDDFGPGPRPAMEAAFRAPLCSLHRAADGLDRRRRPPCSDRTFVSVRRVGH